MLPNLLYNSKDNQLHFTYVIKVFFLPSLVDLVINWVDLLSFIDHIDHEITLVTFKILIRFILGVINELGKVLY